MTKEITKAFIIQQIQDKFQLRELTPERFRFSEMVVPTYDVEQHLQCWELAVEVVSITSATSFTFFTVPATERWVLRAYNISFLGASTCTIAGAFITRHLGESTSFIYLDLTAAQTVSYLNTLPEAVVLEPGDALKINVDGYTSTQDLRMDIDYRKETLR